MPSESPARPNRLQKPQIQVVSRVQLPLPHEGYLDVCRDLALQWVESKTKLQLPEKARQGEAFVFDPHGLRVEAISHQDDDINLWAMRFEHADKMGRHFTTEVTAANGSTGSVLGVRLVSAIPPRTPAPQPSVPQIVKDTIKEVPIVIDGAPQTTSAKTISNDDEAQKLIYLLFNESRQLPVIIASCPSSNNTIIHANRLAWDLSGLAHVFILPADMTFYLTDRLGRLLSVWGGAVRIYMPDKPVEKSYYNSHPLKFAHEIRNWEGEGEAAFRTFLRDRIHRYNRFDQSPKSYLPSFHEIRTFASERQRSVAESRSDTQSVSNAQAENINALKQQVAEWQSFAEDALNLQSEAEQERDIFRAKNHALLAKLRKVETGEDRSVTRPKRYVDIPDWVAEQYPERLLLLRRAERNLKKADFEDFELVLSALELLANEYWEMRVNGTDEHRRTFEQRCAELELGLSRSITQHRAGEFKEQYTVSYKGERRLLESHLTKGSAKETRYTLRIYFFWDDEDQVCVIGHLPDHLDNRMT